MAKQVLSIEQTQHLKELGVDMSKASMCWIIDGENKHKPFITLSRDASDHVDYITYSLPAFNLQDILDLFPSKHEGAYLTITKTDKSYIMGYEDEDGGASPVFINEQAIDSAYEMMCWCAENGIIETKKDDL